MANLRITPLIEKLPSTVPFVGPETQERMRGRAFKARIGANESVFGPSPKVVAAIEAEAPNVWMYGDPENHELKAALAHDLGVKPQNVAIGEGIDALLGYTVRMIVEPGINVATSLGAYPTFNFHVAGFGGRLVAVPYCDDREDPLALVELAREEDASIIYFANPDNPMGTWWDSETIDTLISNVPQDALLCLDEAYGEFAPVGTLPALDLTRANVLRYRTFSKAYGLAGLRVGYVVGHEDVISNFDKIRNHFGVNRIAQAAALAALDDKDYLASVLSQVEKARERIARIASANGLEALPSATNFVAIDCGRNGDHAKAVLDQLIARDVFVRMPGVAPQNRCIRVSAGLPDDLDLFEQTLPEALGAAD